MGWDGMDGSLGLVEYRAPYGANNKDRNNKEIFLSDHLISVIILSIRNISTWLPFPGEHVSKIATKTGTRQWASSNARVMVEICDSLATCCQISSNGLDNPGKDRKRGRTDVYTNPAILGNCAQEVKKRDYV